MALWTTATAHRWTALTLPLIAALAISLSDATTVALADTPAHQQSPTLAGATTDAGSDAEEDAGSDTGIDTVAGEPIAGESIATDHHGTFPTSDFQHPYGSLLAEASRELKIAQHTNYQHTTHVDEATGTFDYDCSGFLDYALRRVDPSAYRALPVTTSSRPLAEDIVEHIRHADHTTGSWQQIPTVPELRPATSCPG